MPIDKRVNSAAKALADVSDGATVLISGFGGAGFANVLIRALCDRGAKNLTLVINSATHRYSLTHELIEAANGDLANWDMRLPNKGPLVGGAMDLAVGARAVWVIMEHMTRKGTPRLLETCTLPLTAARCVKRVYTDLAVIEVMHDGMVVREMLDDMTEAELRARTGAPLVFAPDCRPLVAPPIAQPE